MSTEQKNTTEEKTANYLITVYPKDINDESCQTIWYPNTKPARFLSLLFSLLKEHHYTKFHWNKKISTGKATSISNDPFERKKEIDLAPAGEEVIEITIGTPRGINGVMIL